MEARYTSNSKILYRVEITFFDTFLDESFGSEGCSLEHFLKADNIIIFDDIGYLIEPFFFEIVVIGLDRWWSEENIVGK